MNCDRCGHPILLWQDRHNDMHMSCSYNEPPPPATIDEAREQRKRGWFILKIGGHHAEKED